MSDSEKELKIKATFDGAQAKAGVADLNETLAESALAQDASTEATVAATEATTEQVAAEYAAEAAELARSEALIELSAAQNEAAVSVAAMADAAAAGGAKYEAAILVARNAVAQLEIAQEAVRAAGGPISPAAITQLEVYDGAVAAATAKTEKLGLTTAQSDRLMATFASGNVGGAARGLATLATSAGGAAGALAGVALPVLAVGVALELLPKIIESVQKAGTFLGEEWVKWTLDLGNLKTILDEHGKAIDPLSDKYQKAADAAARLDHAQDEMGRGLVVATEGAAKNAAAVVLNDAATHHWSLTTAEAVAAMKTLGITAPASFEEARQAVDIFGKLYDEIVATKGPAAARLFAESNKSAMEKAGSDVLRLGGVLTPAFKEMADSIGLTTAAMAKFDEKHLTDALGKIKEKTDDLTRALADDITAFVQHASKVKEDAASQIEASEQATAKTIADLRKQVEETEKAHNDRAISDTEYNTKINTLYAEQAKAQQSGFDKEHKIRTDSESEIADLTEKSVEATRKRQEEIDKENAAYTEAKTKLDLVKQAQAETAAATAAVTQAQNDNVAAYILANGEMPRTIELTSRLAQEMRSLTQAAREAAAAVASVPDGGPTIFPGMGAL